MNNNNDNQNNNKNNARRLKNHDSIVKSHTVGRDNQNICL